jgi:hypothetical protein
MEGAVMLIASLGAKVARTSDVRAVQTSFMYVNGLRRMRPEKKLTGSSQLSHRSNALDVEIESTSSKATGGLGFLDINN